MKKIIIFGISDFAFQLYRYIQSDNAYKIVAFTVDKKYCTEKTFHGVPIIPFEEIQRDYPTDEYEFLIAIGYKKMNDIRKNIYFKIKSLGYNVANYIHGTATILADTIGEGNIFLENSCIGIGSVIGNCNVFNSNATVAHDAKISNFNFFAPAIAVAGNVTINCNCFLGTNATIKNSVVIDDYSLVGAGSYISKNTEKYGIYVPERTIQLKKNSLDIHI